MGSSLSKVETQHIQNEEHEPIKRVKRWITYNFTSQDDAIRLLKESIKTNDQIDFENVLKLKILIDENFGELCTNNLKKLQHKFKNKSVVIFIAAKNDKKFAIYWKLKDIRQFLFVQSYKGNFSEIDKYLCEHIADFLVNSLENSYLGISQDQDLWINKGKIELHSLVDTRNFNLLLLASESGNLKPIEVLLKYGISSESPENETNAQCLAWQNRHSDVLLKLVQANLPFPSSINKDECSEELKNFIETCIEFHKLIEIQSKEKLDEILKENSELRYFYNLSNKSAVKAALDLKLIEIYEFLISRNLSFAPHEDTDEIWEEFNKAEKIKLRNINLKFLKEIPEKHINVLMFNTSLSPDETEEEDKRELVLRAYRALNSDSRLKIILKVVAATKVFNIIFDFNRDSTYRIDPTTSRNTKGIFYFSGRILIGAKQLLDPETEHETFGALIHELCHYAVNAVYENQANPYAEDDQEAKEEFARISELCQQRKEEEPVIQSAFDDYPLEVQPSELIVRPPHLIALYFHEPEILLEVAATFNELFHYYINVVIPEMENALPGIEGKLVYRPTQTYGKLTNQNRIKVQNAVVYYKNVKIKLTDLFPENSDILEKLTAEHISQLLNRKKLKIENPQLRYLEELIELKWESLADDLREKCLNSNLNFQGHTIEIRDLIELCPESFYFLTSQEIINILNEEEFTVGKKIESDIEFYVERNFIPEDAKIIRFEYEFGHDYSYNFETREKCLENRTNERTFEEFSDELFNQKFDSFSLILNKVKENPYFKRLYYDVNDVYFHFMHKNMNEIIEQAGREKILILSSEAGAGKTATFVKIAIEVKKKFLTKWVSYIDLKDYTRFYNPSGATEDAEKLLEQILSLDCEKNEFERQLFKESLKTGNTIFIWNGFDEISPAFNEFILSLIKFIRTKNNENIQYVCTRPLYSDQLRKSFGIRTWQLITFDENKKRKFLKEFFTFKKISNEEIEENIERVENIVKKFNYKNKSFYIFRTPLMLKLVAEIHENESLFKRAHIYGIFESFVEKKIEIWLEKSKSTFSIAKKLIYSGSLKRIFQKYALLNEFHIFLLRTLGLKMKKLQILQKLIPQDLPFEEISRIGILFINGKNEFEFSHATFSEFFVAQYFIENIFNADDDVNSEEAELRLELFCHMTKCYGEFQQIITDFMTSFLEMNAPNENKSFNPIISNLLRTKFRNIFVRMLDTNHPKVFEFLFQFFKKDHNLLVELLHVNENETFYTAIFNPNHFALFTNPEEIKSIAKNHLNEEEFKKFLSGKNQKGNILLGMHFYGFLNIQKSNDFYDTDIKTLNGVSFWNFFHKIKGNLTENEQKSLFVTALSPKFYLFYDKIFSTLDFLEYEKLWSSFESLLTKDEMQEALGNALILYFEIKPNEKIGHKIFLKLLLNKIEKFCNNGNSEIFKIFLNKNILHEAHWDLSSFQTLWNFFTKHTNEEERRKILLKDDFDDKNFYFYFSFNEAKKSFSSYSYFYFYFDFTPFKIFHRALTTFDAVSFDFIKEIYFKHFNKREIIEIILNSNDFIYYVIGKAKEEQCKTFVLLLEELFDGNEKLLKDLLERKIKPTNLSIFEIVEDFRGLSHSLSYWFNNLNTYSDLYNRTKIKIQCEHPNKNV